MQIGISTASFYPLLLEEGIALAAKQGFRQLELFLNAESEYAPAFCNECRRRMEDLGVQAQSVHPFDSAMEGHLLFSDYARRTKDALDRYRYYMEAAARLGARYFTFHGETMRARGLPPSHPDAMRFDTYAALCEIGEEFDVVFTQENVSWCRSSDPMFLQLLYEHVPKLRFTLDTKQALRAGRSWRDYVDTVGDRIVNLHVSDYSSESDCLLPGRGILEFGELFRRMKRCGYTGNAIIEVYRTSYQEPEELEEARRYLEEEKEHDSCKSVGVVLQHGV